MKLRQRSLGACACLPFSEAFLIAHHQRGINQTFPNQGVVLDLGCGAGQDSRYLAKLGHRVIGLDRTMPLLQFAKRRAPSVPFLIADMKALPVRSSTLDGIWATASLIHLPKRTVPSVLSELRHLVKVEGILGATFTYGSSSRIKRTGWMPGRYFARWRKDELARTLGRAGWTVLSLRVVSNQERKGRWINVIAKRGAFRLSGLS